MRPSPGTGLGWRRRCGRSIEKGNTAIVAEMIGEATGADLYEILPADDHYPMTYKELTDVALQEQRDGARPAYAGELPDFDRYDTIFIGAPVWWGFVVMSLHAGTHLDAMLPKGKKKAAALGCLGAVSLYGVYAFVKRQIPAYLFLKLSFAFFDFSEPRVFFLADYLAVMLLFAMLGYGTRKLLTVRRKA